ncbi:MAG: kelch repeat-containing protein [Bacteroidota bacterium]
MNKLYVPFIFLAFFILVHTSTCSQAPNSWVQKHDLGLNSSGIPSPTSNAVSFSIGTKGYLGTGNDLISYGTKNFWEYDPSSDTWTQKADFGGAARSNALGFSIGNKGYLGTGYDGSTFFRDFWEYDPSSNTWTQMADFGGTARSGAVGFSIGSKGYVGTGYDGTVILSDFWEYDPSADTWMQKADFAGTARIYSIGISSGGKGYVGTGYNGSSFSRDFWEYDPLADNWTQKADFGGSARANVAGFAISSKVYIGTGINTLFAATKDFWEFDPSTNSWTQKSDVGGLARYSAFGFSIGTRGFLGSGEYFYKTKDVWEYDPSTDAWTQKAGFNSYKRSSAVGLKCGTKGYVGTGYQGYGPFTNDFWEFDPLTNTWSQKADFGGTERANAAGFSIGSRVFIGTGFDNNFNNTNDFWEYDPLTDVWTQKADFGGSIRYNAVGLSIGAKGYLGLGFNGNSLKDFWEYDPSVNTWVQKADFGGAGRYNAVGFSIGAKGYLGTGNSGSGLLNDFWEYDPLADTWSQKADFSGSARYCAVGFSIGANGFIGTGNDNSGNTKDFWEYVPSANTWIKIADLGGTARNNAVGFSIGNKGYVGTGTDSELLKDFWEYTPCAVPSVPVNTTPVSNLTICAGHSTMLSASGSGILGWYDSPSGGSWLGGGQNFTTPVLFGNTMFFVQDSVCFAGSSRTPVFVSVNPSPSAYTGPDISICLNSSIPLGTDPVPGNTYHWTSFPGVFTSNLANPIVTPLVTTRYTLTETINVTGCTNSNSVLVIVNSRPAAIAGANRAVCLNATTQLGAAPVAGNTYSWSSFPGVFTSNLANPIVTPLVTTIYTLTETITATGCTNTNSVLVTVNPLPTPSITGPSLLCAGTTGNVYSTQPGMAGYQWNISSGGTILSPPGTASATIRWDSAGVQFITVNYANSFGCFALSPAVKNITINPLPVPSITGPGSLCLNETGTYSTESGMHNYSWVISPGGSNVSGTGTNTIHVTWTGSGPRTVSVNYLNANNCTAASPSVFNVIVFPLPVPSISGNSSACENSSGEIYSTESGMSNYLWTVSPGGTIISGHTSDSVTVSWGNTGTGTLSVTYTSLMGCNPLLPAFKTITVNPRPVPSISGNNIVCINSGPKAYFTEANQQNYTWNISPGDTILTGSGTSSVTVRWNTAGNRFISVTYSDASGCEAAVPDSLIVIATPLPSAPSNIAGPALLCTPAFWEDYSVSPIGDASGYYWTLPVGAMIQGSSNSDVIHVTYLPDAQSGNITVYGTNACGNGASSSLYVKLNPVPAQPVISMIQTDTLLSNAPFGNQWHYNNQPLPGDTLDRLYVSLSGSYYTIVTMDNCISDTSNIIHAVAVGINDQPPFTVNIHPNPTNGKLFLDFTNPIEKDFKVCMINELGASLYEAEKKVPRGESGWVVDLSGLSPGIFLLTIRSSEGIVKKKIIKN